jgi:hypothetical protein
MPTPNNFTASQFGLVFKNTQYESPIANWRQVKSNNVGYWEGSYTLRLDKASNEYINNWKAFLAELEGSYGKFYAYDPDRPTPLGQASGTLRVNGSNQTGDTLICDGAANNITVFKAGDYVQVANEYKMITEDSLSDGSGNFTIRFKPFLREIPLDNAEIIYTNPKLIASLESDSINWDSDNRKIISLQFSFREAFDYTAFLLKEDGGFLLKEDGGKIIL